MGGCNRLGIRGIGQWRRPGLKGERREGERLFSLHRVSVLAPTRTFFFAIDSTNLSEYVSCVQGGLALRLILLLCLVALPSPARAESPESETPPSKPQKIVIGEVEEVTLVPWGINLPARIDTGADMSALDARHVTIWKNVADFRLGSQQGGLRLRLPVIEWRQVKTSVGSDVRPVVEIGICLGPKFLRTRTLLSDRSEMTYPFLVGRSALKGHFMVDTSRAKAARPVCPPGSFLAEESVFR